MFPLTPQPWSDWRVEAWWVKTRSTYERCKHFFIENRNNCSCQEIILTNQVYNQRLFCNFTTLIDTNVTIHCTFKDVNDYLSFKKLYAINWKKTSKLICFFLYHVFIFFKILYHHSTLHYTWSVSSIAKGKSKILDSNFFKPIYIFFFKPIYFLSMRKKNRKDKRKLEV